MSTQKIKKLIPFFNEPKLIHIVEDVVIVNLDFFTNRYYQTQGLNEFLFTIGGYKNHSVVFLIRDGVNCVMTGIREIIKKVIYELKLTEETCYIYGYDDLKLDNTTFIEMDAIRMWASSCYTMIKDLPISNNQFQKKFAALYGRHDLFRLKIFRHLYTNYLDESLLAFNSTAGQYNSRFTKEFEDDIDWYRNHCPVFLDFEQSHTWYPFQDSLQTIDNHYHNYFIEIVAETDPYSNKFFTEKTMKNFYLGKAFLLWAGPYSLFRLRENGFKTFSPFINESYDTIENTRDRFDALLSEIDRLAGLSIAELQEIQNEIGERLQYNRDYFTQFILTR